MGSRDLCPWVIPNLVRWATLPCGPCRHPHHPSPLVKALSMQWRLTTWRLLRPGDMTDADGRSFDGPCCIIDMCMGTKWIVNHSQVDAPAFVQRGPYRLEGKDILHRLVQELLRRLRRLRQWLLTGDSAAEGARVSHLKALVTNSTEFFWDAEWTHCNSNYCKSNLCRWWFFGAFCVYLSIHGDPWALICRFLYHQSKDLLHRAYICIIYVLYIYICIYPYMHTMHTETHPPISVLSCVKYIREWHRARERERVRWRSCK